MFGQKKAPLLGIDISSSVVKLLELSQSNNKFCVESYVVEPLPVDAVIEGRIENAEEVSLAIKRAVKRASSKAKEAAVAVSTTEAITKIVAFPAALSDRELEEQVMMEAENYVPFPIEEVWLDFEVIGTSASDPDSVDVLLAASRIENVEVRVDVLEGAGLKAKLVDVESYTIENSFYLMSQQLPNQGQGLTVAVVDVGATMTTLHVLVDGKIVFTREQSFGGRMLTEDIERHYSLSYQEAGYAKKVGNLPEDYEEKVLGPFKRSMVTTITRGLQFFFSASTKYHSIDHIILAGGCAAIEGIDVMIEKESGTPSSIANPFADMVFSKKVKVRALTSDAPAMIIACGLAMRSFD